MEQLHALESKLLSNYTLIAARISKVENLDLDRTYAYFKKYTIVVVGEETSSKGIQHQHLFLGSETITIDQITQDIKTIYPDAIGNKCIYVKMCKDPQQLLKYTVKEKNFLYQGLSKTFVSDIQKLSSSKENLKKQFSNLESKVILDLINMDEFMEQHIQLKVDHEQNLYDSHLLAYFKRIAIKSKKMTAKEYSHTFRDRLEQSRGFD